MITKIAGMTSMTGITVMAGMTRTKRWIGITICRMTSMTGITGITMMTLNWDDCYHLDNKDDGDDSYD